MTNTTRDQDALALLRAASREQEDGINMRHFWACVLREWHGPEGLAKSLRDEFNEANAGSNTRAQILNNIVRGITGYDEQDAELDGMNEQELQAQIDAELDAQAQKREKPKSHD